MRQLTALDALFLAAENDRTHGHVSALGVFDPVTASGRPLDAAMVRELVTERMHLLPPLRWRLAGVPLGLDHPYVPGPSAPVYLAGARQRAQFPISGVKDGIGLNITVFSYEDSLEFGIVVDREQVDDPWPIFTACGPICASFVTLPTSTLRTPTSNDE